MLAQLAKRTVRLVATLLAVTFLTALMLDLLPGDPVLSIISADYNTTQDQIEQIREQLGLNDPLHIRYVGWIVDIAQGDFGHSFRSRRPVSELLVARLPVTLQLMMMALLFALAFAFMAASISAMRPGSRLDSMLSTFSFSLISMPNFVLGLILIYVFAVQLDLLPATGYEPLSEGVVASILSLTLPALALAAQPAAIYTRILRAELLNTMEEEYILLARTKGLHGWSLMARHALRPSSLPLITLVGIDVGVLIGGAVIIESLFAVPGVGRLAVDSILGRDYIAVQGVVVLAACAFVIVNYLVDMAYMVLDPRIRHAGYGV